MKNCRKSRKSIKSGEKPLNVAKLLKTIKSQEKPSSHKFRQELTKSHKKVKSPKNRNQWNLWKTFKSWENQSKVTNFTKNRQKSQKKNPQKTAKVVNNLQRSWRTNHQTLRKSVKSHEKSQKSRKKLLNVVKNHQWGRIFDKNIFLSESYLPALPPPDWYWYKHKGWTIYCSGEGWSKLQINIPPAQNPANKNPSHPKI